MIEGIESNLMYFVTLQDLLVDNKLISTYFLQENKTQFIIYSDFALQEKLINFN